jgi:hypothetical protein
MTAAIASTLAGCRASRAMETTLFVAVSCLLLHVGDQSRIRKALSVLLYLTARSLCVCLSLGSLLEGGELKDQCRNCRVLNRSGI